MKSKKFANTLKRNLKNCSEPITTPYPQSSGIKGGGTKWKTQNKKPQTTHGSEQNEVFTKDGIKAEIIVISNMDNKLIKN